VGAEGRKRKKGDESEKYKGKEGKRWGKVPLDLLPQETFSSYATAKSPCSHKKSFSFCGTSSPRPSTGALPLYSTGGLVPYTSSIHVSLT